MLGMHGTYEANLAMHDCDVMICIGARFDDRITGRLDAFSPNSKKIHAISTRPRSTRTCRSRCRSSAMRPRVLEDWSGCGGRRRTQDKAALTTWWRRDRRLAGANCLRYRAGRHDHQAAARGEAALRDYPRAWPRRPTSHRGRPAPDVGGAVFRLPEPNRWMTSGGLGTMGYGLPAAIGVQIAHPDALSSSTSPARPRS
jgi:acetolactate synthase-1/2/3 large subunit